MAIATIEDLQGSIEVVVFPRLYETTRATWRDGSILLVAGRVDHKGEEVSLLADLVDRLGRRGRPRTGSLRPRSRGRGPRRSGGSPRRTPVAVGPAPRPGAMPSRAARRWGGCHGGDAADRPG